MGKAKRHALESVLAFIVLKIGAFPWGASWLAYGECWWLVNWIFL